MSAARPPPCAFRLVARAALLVAAVAAVAIFHVWSHTRVTTAGYRMGELQRAREALLAERNRLEVEVATLRAPGRLESFARARLGMAPPAPGAVVAGRAGGVVAGRAGRVGGEEDRRPAPAEPVVQGPGMDGGQRVAWHGAPGRRAAQ
jgi:cell division protein FtsL